MASSKKDEIPATNNADTDARDKAIEGGHRDALANHKAEQKNSTIADAPTFEDTVKDAHETAKINHQVEQDHLEEGQNEIPANDTTAGGKFRTAKSQLNPTGEKTPSDAEVKDQQDADMTTGNDTKVSQKEVAERSHDGKRVEEQAPLANEKGGANAELDSDVSRQANKNQPIEKVREELDQSNS